MNKNHIPTIAYAVAIEDGTTLDIVYCVSKTAAKRALKVLKQAYEGYNAEFKLEESE